MTADLASTPSRRHDLDWIRVGAFLLLILYHVGMFYVPWGWHVKSGHQVDGLIPAMLLTNPWRLTLLFLVSGAATRFLFDGLERKGAGAGRLAGSRLLRLLPPLIFAMFVIVPPQSYYEIVEALRGYFPGADPYHNAHTADFWIRYATASGNWCDGDGCLITPTWNHMWFVAYLLVYSLLLAGLLATTRGALKRLGGILEKALSGWGLLIWPIVFLAAVRWWLAPIFPITHALTDDWYNHALSFSAFLFGFLIARSETLKQGFIRIRLPALILGLIGWIGWTAYVLSFPEASATRSRRRPAPHHAAGLCNPAMELHRRHPWLWRAIPDPRRAAAALSDHRRLPLLYRAPDDHRPGRASSGETGPAVDRRGRPHHRDHGRWLLADL